MGIISRGFSGRRTGADVKLPPEQYLTTDFPVLSAGPTPHVLLDQWEFTIQDGTEILRRWAGKDAALEGHPSGLMRDAGAFPVI